MILEKKKVDEYLKKIEEAVVDEGKIVTYKWLSRTLGINVNTTKQLLLNFATSHAKSYDDISCVYQVSGVKEDGSYLVTLVNEADITEMRQLFVDIFSEHVFSVQKMKTVENFHLLYFPDPFESTFAAKANTITSSECCLKQVDEVAFFTAAHLNKINKQELKTEEKTEASVCKTSNVPINNNVATHSKSTKSQDSKESVKEISKKITNVKIEENKGQPGKRKLNSISSMFSAQNQKTKEAKFIEKKEEQPNESKKKVKELEEEKMEIVLEKTKKNDAREAKKAPKKRNVKVVEETNEKKRKRIQVFSDSEESDEDSTKERSPSPQPEPEPEIKIDSDKEEAASATDSSHKRKKRKIVDKLVMTKEGYMETTKEIVFETDSEHEAEPPKTIEAKKTPPKQKSPTTTNSTSPKKGKGKAANGGKKQASLFSFFKKT